MQGTVIRSAKDIEHAIRAFLPSPAGEAGGRAQDGPSWNLWKHVAREFTSSEGENFPAHTEVKIIECSDDGVWLRVLARVDGMSTKESWAPWWIMCDELILEELRKARVTTQAFLYPAFSVKGY